MLLCGEGLVLFNERRVMRMNTYELLMVILTIIGLLISLNMSQKK